MELFVTAHDIAKLLTDTLPPYTEVAERGRTNRKKPLQSDGNVNERIRTCIPEGREGMRHKMQQENLDNFKEPVEQNLSSFLACVRTLQEITVNIYKSEECKDIQR